MKVEKVKAEPVADAPKRRGKAPAKPAKKRPANAGTVLPTLLTPVQEAYCRARAAGMSQAEALGSIGSPVALSTVATWEKRNKLINTRIAELSAQATAKAVEDAGLSREWVIDRLMKVANRCMQAEPVLDKKGQPTGAYVFDSAGANASLKMLGDTMGLFKHVPKAPGEDLDDIPDDVIEAIATELGRQTGLLPPPGQA